MTRPDRIACQHLDLDAVVIGFTTLAAYLLALPGIQRVKESIEALITVILPMKLLAEALQEGRIAELPPLLLGRKSDVERRHFVPLREPDHRGDQSFGGAVQARPDAVAGGAPSRG